MNTIKKITAEQKGVVLQEIFSFLLSKNNKARKNDVIEYFLNRSTNLRLGLQENECVEQIEILSTMCVKAEWLEKSGYWKVTEHGRTAYKRFLVSKDLFQEMTVQFAFRNTVDSKKESQISKIRFISLLLVLSPCTILGFLSNSQHLLLLSVFSLIVLVFSLAFYDARTKSIIAGRILGIEFLILIATLYLDAFFVTTSLANYFYVYFFTTLAMQAGCIIFGFSFPHLFSKTFEAINQKDRLLLIGVLLLSLLFGSRPSYRGFLWSIYGENVATIAFTIVFAGLAVFGSIYLLGGMISNLIKAGYYD